MVFTDSETLRARLIDQIGLCTVWICFITNKLMLAPTVDNPRRFESFRIQPDIINAQLFRADNNILVVKQDIDPDIIFQHKKPFRVRVSDKSLHDGHMAFETANLPRAEFAAIADQLSGRIRHMATG